MDEICPRIDCKSGLENVAVDSDIIIVLHAVNTSIDEYTRLFQKSFYEDIDLAYS